jgi:predicted RNA binding protein with dsRBD fold (UPF0201 family)
MWDTETLGSASRSRKLVEYVVETGNVHHLTTSLQTYARERHYEQLVDASVFCALDKHLAPLPIESLRRQPLLNLRLFYAELLRLFEAYPNVLVLPEVKAELANLIAAALAQVDRKKLQYNALSPVKKDQVVDAFNALLRIEELLRKIRMKIEERSKALPPLHERIFAALLEIVSSTAEVLSLKKPAQGAPSDTDERIVARALHEVIVHGKRVCIATRDEDVRRVTSAVYKLLVSTTVRDEGARIVTRALQLGNIVVLKYNAERDEFGRFFESQTQQEIGEFIFAKLLPDKARTRLVAGVRAKLLEIARHKEAATAGADPAPAGTLSAETRTSLLDALATVSDRMLWYQEVARAVGVADIHEEIRIQRALQDVAAGIGHRELAASIGKNLELLARRRVSGYLRELAEKHDALQKELAELTQGNRYQRDLAGAERLRTIALEIAETAREKHFFDRALELGLVHLTHEHFRRAEELIERFAANGFDLRSGQCLIPASEIADLTGRDYQTVLRIVADNDLGQESGLVRVDLAALVRYLL